MRPHPCRINMHGWGPASASRANRLHGSSEAAEVFHSSLASRTPGTLLWPVFYRARPSPALFLRVHLLTRAHLLPPSSVTSCAQTSRAIRFHCQDCQIPYLNTHPSYPDTHLLLVNLAAKLPSSGPCDLLRVSSARNLLCEAFSQIQQALNIAHCGRSSGVEGGAGVPRR